MTVEVNEVSGRDEWDRFVEQSSHTDLFHRWEALAVQAQYAGSRVHHLVGYKGQEPVGLFPVFGLRKGPVTTAFSPPPDLRVPYLGPALLNADKLKQRKTERRHRTFIEGCLNWIEEAIGPQYIHVRSSPAYPDLRPLKWRDFDPTPSYTYHVDLTREPADLLDSFSSDARRNIRDGRDADRVTVREGDREDIASIFRQVKQRYESQGITFEPSLSFLTALYDVLPDGAVRPYVCEVGGEFVGGILAYEHDDTIARWHSGVCMDADVDVAVNDLLDWAVMREAIERGLETYDLVGANNQRINSYKAKFNPDLQEFYTVESGSAAVSLAAHVYKRVRNTSALNLKQ